jgi:kinetochore-associated protein 1
LTFDAVNTSVSDSTLISNDTLELRKISSFKLNDELYSFCLVDSTMIIIAGQKFLHFINGNEIEQVECPSIKKIVKSDHYILGLTKDGNLINICPFTKTFMKFVKSENIFDFMIFDEDEVHFEIITLSENDHSMAIKDFPSLNKRAEWKMSSLNWLVTLYSSSANLYFISGIESDGNVKTVELRCLTETDPTERLRNLISRGLFNEAEKYAKEFGLSVEPVNQAKVQSLLKNLEQSSSDNETLQTYFDEMMKVMEGIEDKNFFSKLYLNEIPSRSHLSQFLQFILKSIDTSKFINETNEINELLLRLETLRLTDPDECNSQWHKILRHNDMFIVAIDHFKIDVMQSCLIFSRHSSSILNNLNMTKFHKWMDRIPPAVDPFLIVQWMKHFLPCFLQFYPEQMTFITDWCLKRTQSLQFSSAWPEIGLEFIKSSYEILSNMNFLCSNIERLYHCNIEKIQNLIFLLEEITVLKTNFHLIVTLDHYKQSSLHQNALYLLQRVQINNLARIVTDFIYPLFTEIGQTPEQTIFEYIQFLCNNKCIGFWQNRAVIAINLLSNEELKLQAALNVLKISPVPWSDTVYPLVKMGKTSCHPLANLIFIEYKTQAIKIIKLKYGWPVDFLDLQQDRIKLVFRILKVANDDMIKDVQTLVESSSDIAHEAYFHLIYKLLELNRLDEIMDVIEFIEKTVETSKMLFETTIDTLINLVKDKTDNNEFCENAVEIIKILFNRIEWDDLNEMKYQKKIKQFTSTLKLKKSFGEQIENIEDESELLKTCVHEITSKLSDDKEIVPEIVNKCNFLSSCLEQNSTACFTKVLDQLKNHFVSCNVTDQFLDNIESLKKDEIPDSLNLLVTIISQLMKFIENNSLDNLPQSDPLVFPICYKLITKCLQNSNISNYDEIVDLMNWIRIGRNCYPHDIIESTREERSKINFSLNSSKKPSNKRESLSIFEVSHFEPKNSPVVNDGNVNLVIQCLLNAMKLICIMSINKSQFFSKLLSEMNLENESSQK